MPIPIYFILLITGVALTIVAADVLVDNASLIARKSGLPEFVIGVVIVGIGTSFPEMTVSVLSSIDHNSDMAIGNITGSNIFNTLLILGITALIAPVGYEKSNTRRDFPFNLLASFLMLLLCFDRIFDSHRHFNVLSRVDGIIFLSVFALYMFMILKARTPQERNMPVEPADEGRYTPKKGRVVLWASLLIVAGLAGLVAGAKLFVNSATGIAKWLGVSDAFIAITIVAFGTSLPELASCIASARKGKGQLALGNIVGSNISNILLILGVSSVIHPLPLRGVTMVDMSMVMIAAILLPISDFIGQKKHLDRFDGAIFVLAYAAYMVYLVINSQASLPVQSF